MTSSLKLGAAFIGVMVGVGFASGREILLFFSSFGLNGLFGACFAMALFIFFLVNLFRLGNELGSISHKEAIEHICGPWLGRAVDYMLILGMFSGMLVMLAGAGSSLEQQFGMPHYIGGLLVCLASMVTVCLGLNQVVRAMSMITPVFILIVAIVAVFALTTHSRPIADMAQQAALLEPKAAGHWILSALLYVSYNVAGTSAVVLVLGAAAQSSKKAALSGVIGGVGIGILLIIMTLVIISKIDVISGTPIPTLFLSKEISPAFGYAMVTFLLIKLYCTTSGLSYALSARAAASGLPFKPAAIFLLSVGYLGSLFGFVNLVRWVYPTMGYLGFVLMAALSLYWLRGKRAPSGKAINNAQRQA